MLELNVKMTKEDCIKICKYVNNVQSKPRLELMTVHTVIGAISWNIGVISYKETSCINGTLLFIVNLNNFNFLSVVRFKIFYSNVVFSSLDNISLSLTCIFCCNHITYVLKLSLSENR